MMKMMTRIRMKMKTKRSVWRWLTDLISTLVLFVSRISVRAEGLELLPENGTFLMVSNHLSAFDPIVLLHLLKKYRMLFVSKPENFNIPIGGWLMKKSGFLAIDRENPRNAIKVIYRAAELMTETGCPMMIYPEGTRNTTPEEGLLPFHGGVFKIAKRAEAPVVVALSAGTDKVSTVWPRKSKVSLKILGVLDSEFICSHNDREISECVREMMESALSAAVVCVGSQDAAVRRQ